MDKQVNLGTIILVAVIFAMGYGFAAYSMHKMAPAVAAQIGGNQALVVQVQEVLNESLGAFEPRLAAVETRLDSLERRGSSPDE